MYLKSSTGNKDKPLPFFKCHKELHFQTINISQYQYVYVFMFHILTGARICHDDDHASIQHIIAVGIHRRRIQICVGATTIYTYV
jgi:hypothetical protein